MKRTYFTIERITLGVTGLSAFDDWAAFDLPYPPLAWSVEPSGMARLVFKRQVGDDTLHRILREVVTRGGRIEECRTERDGLREIMDAFEASDRTEFNAPVV